MNKHSNPVYKFLLIAAGFFFVALGIIGIFLPVMPTTIFLIIAAACFARSSERFYNRLINDKYLGGYIRNYRENRGMTLKSKIIAVTMLNLSIGYSAFVAVEQLWVKILLLAIAVGSTVYILSLKTVSQR